MATAAEGGPTAGHTCSLLGVPYVGSPVSSLQQPAPVSSAVCRRCRTPRAAGGRDRLWLALVRPGGGATARAAGAVSTGAPLGGRLARPPRHQSRPVNTRRLRLRLVFQPEAGRPARWQLRLTLRNPL